VRILVERRRPTGFARAAATPILMLFLCLCGMATGLAIDCGNVPPDILASLCAAAPGSVLATLRLHLTLLPATHGLMLFGAAIALVMAEFSLLQEGGEAARSAPAVRAAGYALCVVAMAAGMALGGWIGPELTARIGLPASLAGLMGAMATGMTLGMVVATVLSGSRPIWRRQA
jgi:hypothetical protein